MRKYLPIALVIGLFAYGVANAATTVPLTKNGAKEYLTYTNDSLGIGSSNPLTPLWVHVGTGQNFVARTTGSALQIGSLADDANSYTQTNLEGNPLVLNFNSGRNVGVATSTPWGLLSINPNALGSGAPEFVIGSSTTTHLLVTGAGNVGIGTTSPTGTLSVAGTVGINTPIAPASALEVDTTPTTNTTVVGQYIVNKSSGNLDGTALRLGYNSNAASTAGISGYFWNTPSGPALGLLVGASELATLNTNGFGIGSTTPNKKLVVSGGGIAISGASQGIYADNGGSNGNWSIVRNDGVNAGDLAITANTGIGFTGGITTYQTSSSAYKLYLASAGNLGVGSTSPNSHLTIEGTPTVTQANTTGVLVSGDATVSQGYEGYRIVMSNTAATVSGAFRAARTAGNAFLGLEIGTETNHDFRFYTNGNTNERARITAAGNFGIGTTTPIAVSTSVAASTTAGTANDGYNGTINIIAGLENTLVKLFQVIDQWGHMITSGDAPTVSGGTSTVAGNDRNGHITVTGTLLTSVTLTFAHAWPTAPDCTMADSSTGVTGAISSISATALTIGFSAGVNSGDVWYICQGHQ